MNRALKQKTQLVCPATEQKLQKGVNIFIRGIFIVLITSTIFGYISDGFAIAISRQNLEEIQVANYIIPWIINAIYLYFIYRFYQFYKAGYGEPREIFRHVFLCLALQNIYSNGALIAGLSIAAFIMLRTNKAETKLVYLFMVTAATLTLVYDLFDIVIILNSSFKAILANFLAADIYTILYVVSVLILFITEILLPAFALGSLLLYYFGYQSSGHGFYARAQSKLNKRNYVIDEVELQVSYISVFFMAAILIGNIVVPVVGQYSINNIDNVLLLIGSVFIAVVGFGLAILFNLLGKISGRTTFGISLCALGVGTVAFFIIGLKGILLILGMLSSCLAVLAGLLLIFLKKGNGYRLGSLMCTTLLGIDLVMGIIIAIVCPSGSNVYANALFLPIIAAIPSAIVTIINSTYEQDNKNCSYDSSIYN
ncbi:MAG: hypothetical protein HUJ61_02210 [Bacilli bacterium]|nr:hypothetical protein [Bacilli bacterium]